MNRLFNLDIMQLEYPVAWECDICYTDPPWEQGMVSMFETWLVKQGLERPGNHIDSILERLFDLWPRTKPLYVEYSVKGSERVRHWGEKMGHTYHETIMAKQTNKKPYVVICFNTDIPTPFYAEGWDVLNKVLEYHKPKRVFEPFAGIGQSTKRILASGSKVTANEINPARFEKLKLVIQNHEHKHNP